MEPDLENYSQLTTDDEEVSDSEDSIHSEQSIEEEEPKILLEVLSPGGARLVFLPAYAPVLNPIEEAFAQVKNWLRRHREAVAQNAGVALIRAIRTVGNEHAGAYMRHAGYNVVEVLPGVFVDPE